MEQKKLTDSEKFKAGVILAVFAIALGLVCSGFGMLNITPYIKTIAGAVQIGLGLILLYKVYVYAK